MHFWERLADGAGNIAYRLALNTMLKSVQIKGATRHQWAVEELKRASSAAHRRGHCLGRRIAREKR